MAGSVEAIAADSFFFVELVWEAVKEGFLWECGMESCVEDCVVFGFFEEFFAGFYCF